VLFSEIFIKLCLRQGDLLSTSDSSLVPEVEKDTEDVIGVLGEDKDWNLRNW